MEFIVTEVLTDLSDDLLGQLAVLRWGYNKEKIEQWKNHMRKNSFGFKCFYLLAVKNNCVIGFAYFCENEINNKQW